MKDYPQVSQIIDDMENAYKSTSGPGKYVVGSLKNLVLSNARVEESINSFSNSTRKTELIMIFIGFCQLILAIVQIVVAFK